MAQLNPPDGQMPASRTVRMPPLSMRADIGPRSINDEARTADLILTTTTGVRRRDWWTGEEWMEVLSMDPAHVRLDRINAGAPLLDSHNAFSTADILGTVVPGSVTVTKKAMLGSVRFSKRDAVEEIWKDVKDGIIRDVSIGYRIHRFEESTGKDNKLPIRTAVDWEPFEASLVPIPADPGAKVRGAEPADANPCEIVTRADVTQPKEGPKKEPTMQNDDRSETIAEPSLRAPALAPMATEPNEADAARISERVRCQGITNGCRSARLPQSFADQLIAGDVSLLDAQTRILEELGKRTDPNPRVPTARPGETIVGEDPLVHVRKGIENALLHRVAPQFNKLEEFGRPYRGMAFLDIGRTYLNAAGIRTTGLSKMELASMALGLQARAGMHTTSDFPLLLADVTAKVLRQAYSEAPQTFEPISRRVTLPDFKLAKRMQLGEAPALLEVLEHGEFTHGTIGEGREQFQLKTYGRIFAITRQALVNDDTDAFARVATMFGRSARTLESDLVWAQITSNPNMGDGNALFVLAAHGNLASSSAAISLDSLTVARAAMRNQTGLDGVSLLNLTPRFLYVPPGKETIAQQFVAQNMVAAQASNVNPFAGAFQVIAEPRLEAASATAWYLFADPSQIDIIEVGTLEGEGGPAVESRIGFDIDGLEIKARHDFAAKVIDWRGAFKNAGA